MIRKNAKTFFSLLVPFIFCWNIVSAAVDYEVYANEVTKQFVQKMEEELGLICCADGGGMPYDIESLHVMFTAYQRANLEQARDLEVYTLQKFQKMINDHEKIRPYLREYPFPIRRVEVSFLFKNLDNDPYTDGSITHVFQAKNKIFYISIDPITKKKIKSQESYEEALKKVKNSPPPKIMLKKKNRFMP